MGVPDVREVEALLTDTLPPKDHCIPLLSSLVLSAFWAVTQRSSSDSQHIAGKQQLVEISDYDYHRCTDVRI